MVDEDKRVNIQTLYGDVILLDNPSFDNSIIGITNDLRVVYRFDLMCEEFALDNNCSFEDAEDFIGYNTIRSLPYIKDGPIVIISSEGDF